MYCAIANWAVLSYLNELRALRGARFPLFQGVFLLTTIVAALFVRAQPVESGGAPGRPHSNRWYLGLLLSLLVGIIYLGSNPNDSPYDYTWRIAHALLSGELGIRETPPGWLTEFVPLDGWYYSVFPLGAVLTLLPVAFLHAFEIISTYPEHTLIGFFGAIQTLFVLLISRAFGLSTAHRVAVALLFSLGTWHWTNLTFGGAWQLALGAAVVGELGALYFSAFFPRPFIGGCFFALAFGNRTELLLLAPLFLWFVDRQVRKQPSPRRVTALLSFITIPLLLGLATLAYNYARFSSVADFGYARIPGVLEEPWYAGSIFHLNAIWPNFREMLLVSWKHIETFPYLTPTGFGGSILLSCPFLVLIFRRAERFQWIRAAAWCAIFLICLVLWCHGNPGGWQYSYRYGATLLPWFVLLYLQGVPAKMPKLDIALVVLSIAINTYATYLFHWTPYVQP